MTSGRRYFSRAKDRGDHGGCRGARGVADGDRSAATGGDRSGRDVASTRVETRAGYARIGRARRPRSLALRPPLNPYPLPDWHPALSPKSGTRSPPDNAPPTDVATRNAAIPRVVATHQMSNRSRTAAPDPIGAPRVAPGRRPARYPTCGKWEQTACNTSSAAPDVLLTRRGRSP